MKTHLLFLFLSATILMEAQVSSQGKNHLLHPDARPHLSVNEGIENSSSQRLTPGNNQTQSFQFSSSRNGFGTLVEQTCPLQYNADLNMLAFTQRIPPATAWPTTGLTAGAGTSGYVVTRYSMDGGLNWDGVCYFQNDADFARYPSGVIANPLGNTDPALAKFVATGPCTSNPNWTANYFASVPVTATGNITNNDQQIYDINLTNPGKDLYFSCYGTVANGSTVWTGARKYNGSRFGGVAILKGTPGATVNDPYVWTQDSITFGPFKYNSDSDYYALEPRIAFGPDGQTGYVVVFGVLANATGYATQSMQPVVWKTTDAGQSWNLVNANYEWQNHYPYLACNLMETAHDGDWNGSGVNGIYASFMDAHGTGITVDANGYLHLVTTITPAYSSHPDSLFYLYASGDNIMDYGFSYVVNDDSDKPVVFDFKTNGNGNWNFSLVSQLFTRSIKDDDVVPDPAIWTTDGTAPMAYNNRIRVSRSNDGTKIFYTWTDGDTTNIIVGTQYGDVYHANSNPNIYYKGFDVATNKFTPTNELNAVNAFESGYYNSYVAPIAMPVSNGYMLPATYIVSQNGGTNATNPIDYYFVNEMVIDSSSYAINQQINIDWLGCVCFPPPPPPTTDIEITSTIVKNVSNYPNPCSTGTIIKFALTDNSPILFKLCDPLGKEVYTEYYNGKIGENKIDVKVNNFEAGIYLFTILTGKEKFCGKMIILK